jgi:hypothetical protein
MVIAKIKQFFIGTINKITLDNFFSLTKTLLFLVIVLHMLACIWIGIGFKWEEEYLGWFMDEGFFCTKTTTSAIPFTDSTYSSDETYINAECIWNYSDKIYFTSFYFTATTTTTVGYGDISGYNNTEKMYIMLLEFFGISIFSIILGQISGLDVQKSHSDIVSEKEDEITFFLY